ncbi:Uncharacterized protein APZ42_002835, partial [Daphnia magna]
RKLCKFVVFCTCVYVFYIGGEMGNEGEGSVAKIANFRENERHIERRIFCFQDSL